MANLNTGLYTLQLDGGLKRREPDAQKVTGSTLWLQATYTVTAAETTGDTILIGILPPGSVVLPWECTVASDGTGGTGAITKIGDALDDDRYSATSIAVTAAAVTRVTSTNLQAVSPYATIDNAILQATVTFATAMTAGKLITFHIAYRQHR